MGWGVSQGEKSMPDWVLLAYAFWAGMGALFLMAAGVYLIYRAVRFGGVL
jgi:multidrug transporter EmrE-like cation transporter